MELFTVIFLFYLTCYILYGILLIDLSPYGF